MSTRRTFLAAASVPALHGWGQRTSMFGDAEAYERFMGRWSRLVATLLVDFTDLPDGARVLDVGSGTGSLASAIAGRKPQSQVVGIDPSKEYVAYANAKNRFPGRVSFEVGDAQALTFPDGSFNAALSLLVFNFIPDPAKALREVRRATKPGGPIAAAVWDYGAGMQMLRLFWDAAVSRSPAAEKRDEKHMPLCRAGELSALWKQGGLDNVHEQPLDITTRFKSFADYWDPFLLRQGPAGNYVSSLDSVKLQMLRQAVKSRLRVSAEDQPFDLVARVWAVRGTVPG